MSICTATCRPLRVLYKMPHGLAPSAPPPLSNSTRASAPTDLLDCRRRIHYYSYLILNTAAGLIAGDAAQRMLCSNCGAFSAVTAEHSGMCMMCARFSYYREEKGVHKVNFPLGFPPGFLHGNIRHCSCGYPLGFPWLPMWISTWLTTWLTHVVYTVVSHVTFPRDLLRYLPR